MEALWELFSPSYLKQQQKLLCADETPSPEIKQFIQWAEQCLNRQNEDTSDEHTKMGDQIYKWTADLPARAFNDCWVSEAGRELSPG